MIDNLDRFQSRDIYFKSTGVNRSTACAVIHRVSKAICSKKSEFIALPGPEEMRELADKGFRECNIPGELLLANNSF